MNNLAMIRNVKCKFKCQYSQNGSQVKYLQDNEAHLSKMKLYLSLTRLYLALKTPKLCLFSVPAHCKNVISQLIIISAQEGKQSKGSLEMKRLLVISFSCVHNAPDMESEIFLRTMHVLF